MAGIGVFATHISRPSVLRDYSLHCCFKSVLHVLYFCTHTLSVSDGEKLNNEVIHKRSEAYLYLC